MLQFQGTQRLSATLPDGTRVNLKDLPPVDTTRWVSSRKATVAKAVIAGLIGEEEAIARYQLSNEELQGWVSAYQKSGERELKATRPFKS
ncbi:DUF1153 domain-containing protein [Tritonibacter mobilis]|uniref:DUF1153 domain-containing protein n=1 Tax=Tritonibacter mobilis TaxID=379347 RepID=UPI001403F182|nr:DUF1153 domain-containing protein [Tritonibacter mobilis]NHM20543.1 DUF1153 domain-containing protein [Tritonibacter mobilis]NHM24705.1 DUF1153 domain-containing protein [Tritonibacter mobilis]